MGKQFDVIIIGAGLSGICVSDELHSQGINHLIIEKGQVGNSWRNMPDFLTLISPWYCNKPRADKKNYSPTYKMPALEYANQLSRFVKERSLPIKEGVTVFGIQKKDEKFVIKTSDGEYIAKTIVMACGYFDNPIFPIVKKDLTSKIKELHFKDYKSVEESVLPHKKVLIVGKRISGGQLLVELSKYSELEIAISAKSNISYGPNECLWGLIFPIYPVIEKIAMFFGISPKPSDPSMFGGKTQKLLSSKVKTYSEIDEITKSTVKFKGGEEESFDLIIYATGFEYGSSLQWEDDTGVLKIGEHGQINYRSRFLRGIKEDAVEVAKKVREYLGE